LEALTTRGLPTSRDENWKYANLRPLERVSFAPVISAPGPQITSADLPQPINGYARYIFVDGTFVPELSSSIGNTGVRVRSLRGRPKPGAALSEAFTGAH